MAKPLIGITTYNGKSPNNNPITAVQHTYIRAVTEAGGLPVLIPCILSEQDYHDLYSRLQGIMFTGGGDISPEYFNGSGHVRISGVDEIRDAAEFSLLRKAVRDGKPLLGICRGVQVLNVALGGTLYTHIAEQVKGALDHDYPGDLFTAIVHPVSVDEFTRAAEIFGETLLHVNSLHHQGLKDIAPPLKVAGHAPDGIVEIVEIPDHPYAVGVQWHPEWLTGQSVMRRLFKSFVDASNQ
ncbi:MAG: gamma-glutamyl-gamma-aminobutyrate hydrolase family protein [Anaerolineales bacterium]|nr:MAG: gamma-glutamyl-gamma-aminobutyrate hydrolase family protein [Anaerolineales bacterium]